MSLHFLQGFSQFFRRQRDVAAFTDELLSVGQHPGDEVTHNTGGLAMRHQVQLAGRRGGIFAIRNRFYRFSGLSEQFFRIGNAVLVHIYGDHQ